MSAASRLWIATAYSSLGNNDPMKLLGIRRSRIEIPFLQPTVDKHDISSRCRRKIIVTAALRTDGSSVGPENWMVSRS
jgi:hypothetical protein